MCKMGGAGATEITQRASGRRAFSCVLCVFGLAFSLSGFGGCEGKPETQGYSFPETEDEKNIPGKSEDTVPVHDLAQNIHLADVWHHGSYIDFASDAYQSHTFGGFFTGFNKTPGPRTDAAGRTQRIFFNLLRKSSLVIRAEVLMLKARRLAFSVNGNSAKRVEFETEGGSWRTVRAEIPESHTQNGINSITIRSFPDLKASEAAYGIKWMLITTPKQASRTGSGYVHPVPGTLVGRMTVDDESRSGIVLRSPSTLSYFIRPDPGSKLGFGIGVRPIGAQGGEVEARITVRQDGHDPAILFTRKYHARSFRKWEEYVLDLDRFSQRPVRLDLAAYCAPGTSHLVAFSYPTILAPGQKLPEYGSPRGTVLLIMRGLSAHLLSSYSTSSVRDPNMSRFSRKSIVFEKAMASSHRHREALDYLVRGNGPVPGAGDTGGFSIFESLGGQVERAAIVSSQTAAHILRKADTGLNSSDLMQGKNTEEVLKKALDWLKKPHEKKFLLVIEIDELLNRQNPPVELIGHYNEEYAKELEARLDPVKWRRWKRKHRRTGLSPEEKAGRYDAVLKARVELLDGKLKEFFKTVLEGAVSRGTAVILTAPLGASSPKNDTGSEKSLRVPLVMYLPGLDAAPVRIPYPVSTSYIMGAAVDLLGVPRTGGSRLEHFLFRSITDGTEAVFIKGPGKYWTLRSYDQRIRVGPMARDVVLEDLRENPIVSGADRAPVELRFMHGVFVHTVAGSTRNTMTFAKQAGMGTY